MRPWAYLLLTACVAGCGPLFIDAVSDGANDGSGAGSSESAGGQGGFAGGGATAGAASGGGAAGAGGQCVDNLLCEAHCSVELGCIQCLSNADCRNNGKPICVAGTCQECGDTGDCGTGKACFPKEHECEPSCNGPEGKCEDEAPTCLPDGACVECTSNNQCGGQSPVCSLITNQCAECAEDDDCGAARPRCLTSSGRCVICLTDTDCGSGFVCDQAHQCRQLCDGPADCPAAAPACHNTLGVCVECQSDAQCSDAEEPKCGTNFTCGECASSAHCSSPTPVCDNQTCFECKDDDDCPSPAQPKCERHQCTADN